MIDPSERVAIVGIGGVFPGARDPERFWQVIQRGEDATTEVPSGRWWLAPEDVFDPVVATPDRVYATRGGFVRDFNFDPAGLDLDPALASELDPSFQLALHVGRAAWRDAKTERLDPARVSVIFGNIVLPTESASTFARETLGEEVATLVAPIAKPGDQASPTHPFNLHAAGLPAGLVAQALGLGGGAYTLDAACASSLYALKLASIELLSGRSDAVLTGGVSRPDPLYTQMGFSQLRALAADGRAYPFDQRGGGLVVGEGAGLFVLKRLSDALSHGDHIYGIVVAVGLSNDVDGGLLAPSGEGQLRAMNSAYNQAGWDPRGVDLIECHATGTPVGDAVEFQSLRTLWGETGWEPGGCVIGSHKANIGHSLTAAGAAGLIKVLMALKHQALPPTPNFDIPGPGLAYDGSPFRVLKVVEKWLRRSPRIPRRAALSGFGFGGINAHALIEEWLPNIVATPTNLDPESDADPVPIAIVGVGAQFGSMSGRRAVQEFLLGGGTQSKLHLDTLEIPLDRFRIPPKELEEMLPQQLLALLAAAEAIDDAGWEQRHAPRLRTGVFVGITLDPNTTNFHVRWDVLNQARKRTESLRLALSKAEFSEWVATLRDAVGPALTANRTMGALGGLVASRIAREFRLGGPSFTVSSEESSGLRAVEIAIGMLRRNELDEAIVGAVDLTADPRVVEATKRLNLGEIPRSDGAAAFVLKRLDDAERDGNSIYALIQGIGGARGTASEATHRSELRALDDSAIDAAQISLFEHYGSPHTRDPIGHMGAASGLASLLKAVLCLHQQILPPRAETSVGPRYWLQDRVDGPRRALVSGIGIDGVSLSVVLEEYPREQSSALAIERVDPLGARSIALFVIEADDEAERTDRIDSLDRLAADHPEMPIEALARRWWKSHPNDPSALLGTAVVARSTEELRERLRDERRTLGTEEEPLGRSGQVAFVFPGIGNHFAGMGRDLSARWPEIFRSLDTETLRLRSQLAFGASWHSDEPQVFPDQRAPILGQVVLGTVVFDLLQLFSVKPDAVIGYSLGESSALFAIRAWTERDVMHTRLETSTLFRTDLAGPCEAARSAWKLKTGEPADWTAGILTASPQSVRRALADIPRAYLLIINTSNEVVVGGRRREVERLVKSVGGTFLPLPVVSTVHCEIARQVETPYRALHTLKTTPPLGIRVYSTGWGKPYLPDRETAADAIVAQALQTVDFPAVILRAYDDGVRIFLETGPGASCSRAIRMILGDRSHFARSACVPGEDALATLLELLAGLIIERVPVDLFSLYGRESRAVAVDDPRDPSKRHVTVTVGIRPFKHVPLPTPSLKQAGSPSTPFIPATSMIPAFEAPPTVIPTSFESSYHTNDDVPHQENVNAVMTLPSDPLVQQLLATEQSRGRAHETYLRVSGELSQTLANHLAFQMALIDSLIAAPTPTNVIARPPSAPVPVLNRERCLEFAIGSIGNVLGPEFAAVDAYPTRVRLPDEPLMLVDRILLIEGESRSLTAGRIVTEHDVLADGWYLDGNKIPTCIAVESGQADLFLSGYLGIDFITKGKAVYRLLDATVIFHQELPGPGEVIHYDIHIDKFFRQGDTHLFRFRFEATVDGSPLMSMRDGCAGFFTEGELAAGKGIVHTALDLRPIPGKRPSDWRELVPQAMETYNDDQIDALRRGDHARAFGATFEGLDVVEPLILPGGRMTLIHRVPLLDPTGGRHGLGLIRGELDIHSDDWFLTCHFVDDQVMPGTLMYECCLHTLRVYLMRLGWIAGGPEIFHAPVAGVASRLKCRGQVTASTKSAVFEISIKELGFGPEPFAIADALMYADGRPVVEVIDMSIRLCGSSRDKIEHVWNARNSTSRNETRVLKASETSTPLYGPEKIRAFAEGKPSEAFGDRYRPFDTARKIARLPRAPYSFLDRIIEVKGEPWVMAAGAAAVGEYDVSPDAWYFLSNRSASMPFAVLLEIPLQVCGWLSAYVGSALADEHDLSYRNLGGTGTLHVAVSPDSGTLTSRVVMTRVSKSGGMIIQHFDIETADQNGPVYTGQTYFGFFRQEALRDQVGIRDASPYRPTAAELSRARSFDFPRNLPFPDDRLRMIDHVDTFVPDGGPHGLGFIVGSLPVNPASWFFEAHFYQDPVVPGSLGLESFLQLLKVIAVDRWGWDESKHLEFQPIGLGTAHQWIYRGQVLPSDKVVTVQAVVTKVDDEARRLTAEGFLTVDGRIIYQMNEFSMGIV